MTSSPRAQELARTAAEAAVKKKATHVVAIDVSERLVITDVFVVLSGSNERQVCAIVEAVDEALSDAGATLIRREGCEQARWVLLDFGELVVHVQHDEDREHYALERLWADCPILDLSDIVPRKGAGPAPAPDEGDAALSDAA